MPIILDDNNVQSVDINTTTQVSSISPLFFSSKLTGKGKKTGLLNDQATVGLLSHQVDDDIHLNYTLGKKTIQNGQVKQTYIQVCPIPADAWRLIDKASFDFSNAVTVTKGSTKYRMNIAVQSIMVQETPEPYVNAKGEVANRIVKKLFPLFRIETVNESNVKQGRDNYTVRYTTCFTNYGVSIDFVTYVPYWIRQMFQPSEITKTVMSILDINVYDMIERDALCFNSDELLEVVGPVLRSKDEDSQVAVLEGFEHYNVSLDTYKSMYLELENTWKNKPSTLEKICKRNINMLLNETLFSLNNKRASLQRFVSPVPADQVNIDLTRFSKEQKKSIMCDEPLILTQAGAGTGKSHTIIGRIEYMVACGVKPEDITVLSFTNAAADNISNRNPNVHSMTIARMIHEIYELNFPTHKLSTVETIMNSLRIFYPTDNTAREFYNILKSVSKSDKNAFTMANAFIEANYDKVIDMLNTMKQTSLELEIIICYQQIDNLSEPARVASKYLIVDEVQDNSIFEFIYTLKYVDKHNENLFIVGDCSQTLYEFRASNPRALNALEASGVFKTFQLNTNYRSNQEILDFANVALERIEANQYANISLKANSLVPVTEQSFKDKISFIYERLKKLGDWEEVQDTIVTRDVVPYIKNNMARGEQTAIIAFQRHTINKVKALLETVFPDKKIISIVPEKVNNNTFFSKFIANHWNEVKFMANSNIASAVAQAVNTHIGTTTYNKKSILPICQEFTHNWFVENEKLINSWYSQVGSGLITKDELLELVKENMIDFEINHNAIRQALISEKNNETKANSDIDEADIVLSTIHSVKGLEFDNVVVFYKNDQDMSEENKRMYYVAFTRAINSEFIITYDTVAKPQIEADYNMIIQQLHVTPPSIATAIAQLNAQRGITDDVEDVILTHQEDSDDEDI